MSTTLSRTVQCDLCAIDSNSVGAQMFKRVGLYDFCRWCMSGPVQSTACGGHEVTVANETWTCSCGTKQADVIRTLGRHGVATATMGAVPNLTAATAAIHVQTPSWPKTY